MATLKRKSPEFVNAPDATPNGPPAKRMRLTQSQKQALIDNLQLESECNMRLGEANQC
jgi:hypothetical protein